MFEVFNKDNVMKTLNKTPIICFYAELGACGSPGLMLTVFDDGSSYGYSAYYDNSDKEIIRLVMESIPEIASLLRPSVEIDFKREKKKSLPYAYLGLGNHSLLRQDIYEEMMDMDDKYTITKFRKTFEKYSNFKANQAYLMVKEAINGHI